MDPDTHAPHLAPIYEEAARFPLVFAHVGSLFDPDSVAEDAAARLPHGPIIDVSSAVPKEGGILVGFERLIARPDRCERLSQLRAATMQLLDKGGRFVAVSRVPKVELLGCDGSQLIIDARTVFPIRLSAESVESELSSLGFGFGELRQRCEQCLGSPVLLRAVSDAAHNYSDNAKARNAAIVAEIQLRLTEAAREAGPLIGAFLDDSLLHNEQRVAESEVDPLIVEALRGTGFAAIDRRAMEILLFHSSLLDVPRRAILASNDMHVESIAAPDAIYAALWEIERRVRKRLKELAMDHHGASWQEKIALTGDHERRVLDRASADLGVRFDSLTAIGNPLQWMTLDETLELIETQPDWACPPEVPTSFFRRMRSDLQPIRNRSAHCRLPQYRDQEIAFRWRLDLARRLATT